MFMYGMVDTFSFLQLFIPLLIYSLLLTYSITIICVCLLSMSLSSLFISINSLNLKWIQLLLLLLHQLSITTHITTHIITTLPALLLLLRYSDDIDFNIIGIVMISITIINITIIIDNNNDINNNNNHNHPSLIESVSFLHTTLIGMLSLQRGDRFLNHTHQSTLLVIKNALIYKL